MNYETVSKHVSIEVYDHNTIIVRFAGQRCLILDKSNWSGNWWVRVDDEFRQLMLGPNFITNSSEFAELDDAIAHGLSGLIDVGAFDKLVDLELDSGIEGYTHNTGYVAASQFGNTDIEEAEDMLESNDDPLDDKKQILESFFKNSVERSDRFENLREAFEEIQMEERVEKTGDILALALENVKIDEAKVAKPIPDHDYHKKTDAQLRYIMKDAKEAADAMKGHSPSSESKYLDQVNDAATVLHYRKKARAAGMNESQTRYYHKVEAGKEADALSEGMRCVDGQYFHINKFMSEISQFPHID
jgi:hypothetical protein